MRLFLRSVVIATMMFLAYRAQCLKVFRGIFVVVIVLNSLSLSLSLWCVFVRALVRLSVRPSVRPTVLT